MTGATGNIYCGLHEFIELTFLLHLLRPNDLSLNIGANVGSYIILAARVLRSTRGRVKLKRVGFLQIRRGDIRRGRRSLALLRHGSQYPRMRHRGLEAAVAGLYPHANDARETRYPRVRRGAAILDRARRFARHACLTGDPATKRCREPH